MKHTFIALVIAAAFVGAFSTSSAQAPESAYMMRLPNNWLVAEDLDDNTLMISLQGIANKQGPKLYFVYPEDWPFKFTEPVYDYYGETRNIDFEELTDISQALDLLGSTADGYVVWDRDVRTSLTVAFTVAGLENAIVVSEDQIPMVESAGLEMIEDFRG